MTHIRSLEPQILWKYFDDILKIPRPSKKEEQIRGFLIKFAEENKRKHKTDKAGNLLISKEASPGLENKKTVVLQSHLDMVCEKNNDVIHDFGKDEITARIEGEWITANGTTLGADDGIGIASQMAILASDSIEHGPLECLFTVDEETGLTGAMALEKDFFEAKILLNLDSEDEGELFIGCAGGVDTIAEFKYKTRIFPSAHIAAKVSVSGLKGGHSGDEIHKSPGGNSNKILNRFLWNAAKNYAVRLSEFDGGNLRNAIPREAYAIIAVPSDNWRKLRDYFTEFSGIIKNELSATEPDVKLKLEKHEAPEIVLSKKSQSKLLASIYACPHGVIKWSDEVENMVETSTNLASVKFKEPSRIIITTSQRSSIESAKKDIADRVFAIFESIGAKVRHTDGYPGWSPDQNSEILKITESGYAKLFNEKPVVRAIHAGLECGLFLAKYPELDMISFGPTIKRAHSPDEKINIPSTDKYWKLLLEVLKNIPENQD